MSKGKKFFFFKLQDDAEYLKKNTKKHISDIALNIQCSMKLFPSLFHISPQWGGNKIWTMSHYDPWLFFFGPACHLAVTRQSRWFQVKLSTIKWLSEWVCVDALLISSYDALASRLPLFGLFPCRFTLPVREQPWTELRWGMALSDHHYTSPPFHLHLIILISPWGRVRARLFVFSVLSCFTFECACASVRERQCRRRRRRKMREGKGEKGASIWYSHYTSCRFHLHLIVCLIAGKKQVIYQAWRGSWSLFPRHGALCVCLCLYVSANVCSTSIQTTVAFACVQWPNCGYELWQYLPKKNYILMAKRLYVVWVWT